jgi:hypothetical protein
MTGIKQKYQDLFFQTEQTVNRKKSGFRAAHLKASFFLKPDQCQPPSNHKTQPLWVQQIRIVPNCHTLAGFAIGALDGLKWSAIEILKVT